MTLSACLVCRFAERASAGQVVCRLDDSTHETMHVCFSFVGLWINEMTTAAGRFSSCNASTTATNCPSGHKRTCCTTATNSTSDENRGKI